MKRSESSRIPNALVLSLLIAGFHAASGAAPENVKAWGSNQFGSLGIGMDENNFRETLPGPVANLTGVVAVSGGEKHSLALKSDGTVWAWGDDEYGQLGNGADGASNTPVLVSNLTNVIAIAAGQIHSLALKADGSVWGWGSNWYGQLGDGGYDDSDVPERIGSFTDIVAIEAGRYHNLVLRNDGTVWAWGENGGGQVGIGNNDWYIRSPVAVTALTGVAAIAAGGSISLGLKSDGTVWSWGSWYPPGSGSNVPVRVTEITGATAIAAGDNHSLVLTSDGTLWAWGLNSAGQLGNPDVTWDTSTPVKVRNLTSVVAVSAGDTYNFASKNDGTLWVWGWNEDGQFGNGSTTDSKVPILLNNLTGVARVSPAFYHTLALRTDGTVQTWGRNDNGQLGNGRGLNSSVPVTVPGLSEVISVQASLFFPCSLALTTDGSVYGWGYYQNDLCNGRNPIRNLPVEVSGLAGVTAIALGSEHRMTLQKDGTVWSWGSNSDGQLGSGATGQYVDAPVVASGLSHVVAIAAGYAHSLALRDDGTVWTWGSNSAGQLGDGTTTNSNVPLKVNNLKGVVAIAAGGGHSVALKSDGTVWSWGANGAGQLGNGTRVDSKVPVLAVFTGARAIVGGGEYSLVLKNDGTVWGWGDGYHGQLGSGLLYSSTAFPVRAKNLTDVVAIAVGKDQSFAIQSDGTAWRWGDYLSDESRMISLPTKLDNLQRVVAISGSGYHSLAATSSGVPAIAISPQTIAFGSQRLGMAGSTRIASITNTGEAPLEIHSVILTGIDPADFTKTADTCTGATVMPGSSCGLSARFGPKALGSRSAALLVTSNAPGATHFISLSGTGTTGNSIFVQLVTPNGGETLFSATPYTIQWTASSNALPLEKFDVQFSKDGGANFTVVPGCTNLAAGKRTCLWPAPGPVTTTGRIRVIAYDTGDNTGFDISDTNFSVATGKGVITLTAPVTAVNWALRTKQEIRWTSNLGPNARLNIDLSRNGGTTWRRLADEVSNTGTFALTVNEAATTAARIRISWAGNGAVQAVSSTNFTIAQPFIKVLKPNGGEQWKKRTQQTVTWTSNLGSGEMVEISVSTDGGINAFERVVESTPSDGTQQITLPNMTGNRCRIRIRWLKEEFVFDLSNANFSIVP